MNGRQLAVRAAIPQLCLALLLCAGLMGILGSTIIYRRVWIEPPPPSAQIVGPPSANNSPTLQQQVRIAIRNHSHIPENRDLKQNSDKAPFTAGHDYR